MKRNSAFVTIVFLAGLGTGFFAHSAGVTRLLRRDPHAADLAAIEKLHQKDIEVTLRMRKGAQSTQVSRC